MKKHVTRLVAVLLLATSGAVQAIPIFDIQGGQLMGASGVDVSGALYDVEFVDGTCIDLYDGCDEVSDFTFQNQADAEAASQALLQQVLLDGVDGIFDTIPANTNGCTDGGPCFVMTIYGVFSGSTQAISAANSTGLIDILTSGGLPISIDTTALSNVVYARWTSHDVIALTEPSAPAVFGLGILVMILARRRHQEKMSALF